MKALTYTGAALGTLLAVWLTLGAYRGHHAGTTTGPVLVAAIVVAACLLTLSAGLVLLEHRATTQKGHHR